MPEIWLPYGSVKVAVNIKTENVGVEINPRYPPLGSEDVQEVLGRVDAHGETLIFAPKTSEASTGMVRRLVEHLVGRGFTPKSIAVFARKEALPGLRRGLEAWQIQPMGVKGAAETIGVLDGVDVKVPKVFNGYDTKIMVSDVSFDPLFGFDGGPASLVRYLGGDLMAKAFSRRMGDRPAPGEVSEASRFADGVGEMLSGFTSVEAVAGGEVLSGIHIGSVVESHRAASEQLTGLAKVVSEGDMQAAVASPGGLPYDRTLASALPVVWNVIGGLRERGVLAVLAECSEGLGSRALELYVSGRLDPEGSAGQVGYVEGLEDLLYLKTVLRKYLIVLVSTLPNYYVEVKMGMNTCRRAGEAVAYILKTAGQRVKIHLVHRSSEALVSSTRR